ncbi:MAG: thioredoxin domain-containing protein [Scytolyngbya sp. HA4215-MV1]|nr:thioredoxin domain-containing protein [Scytolyngbya sp. HA4215-MV1]
MTNRLAQSQSLYLRKHAENPIDWWPWCEEALTVARRDNKPIFLSIGYSSCHWCTVMEGEAFSDRDIAEFMNTHFLPIKVDREERPDLDSIYMQAVQMMIGQGGWPLNAFLSPDDLIPFYGGTYFPVEPRYNRPGFLQVLQTIRRYYDTEKDKVKSLKAEILSHLQNAATLQSGSPLSRKLLKQGLDYSTGILSAKDRGPSFPMIPYAEAALRNIRFGTTSPYDAPKICLQRGRDLSLGGIFDHVGGGFHRYTVDATWTVPHFEKMLYDNGQIMEYLANLWAIGFQEPAFDRAITLTVQWLQREMTAPQGYFYAAQDADNFADATEAEPEEGAFYVWDYDNLTQWLTPEELAALSEQFTLSSQGNFEGFNVLQRRQLGHLSDVLEATLQKLFTVRYGVAAAALSTFPAARNNQEAKSIAWQGRIPPVTDTKMIVAWNSLMISGLARAAAVFQRSPYLELATQAAQFILDQQWSEGRFQRLNYDGQATVSAQAEDYALFVKALLDLQQVDPTNSSHWLQQAKKVQEEFDEFLWSVELGGYYNTASDASSDLLIRERSYLDSATPSANGVAIANLVRLALLTEELAYLDQAEQALQSFSSVMQKTPQACPTLFSALDWFQHHTLIRTCTDRLAGLHSQYLPTAVCQAMTDLPSGSVGLVCQGLSCNEPALSLEQLQEQIQASQSRD